MSDITTKFTKKNLEALINKKGLKWYQNELNIIGIRNSEPSDDVTNKFDDWIIVVYKKSNKWFCEIFSATTDPGRKSMVEYNNPKGVARLVPGQYLHCWEIGLHQGKYEALKQTGKVKVTRDKDKDLIYDGLVIDEGIYGINIHKAGQDSVIVDKWSEGCQVFKREEDFNKFMRIVKANGAEKFTYTLIESKELD